ncbi:type I secretion system permease/ATPase, partial [Methylobacterium nigriterrae]|uniref:type I secretion system permease/ATPase n=1 Tax=Methylobacterium nigriterrae TaxID=3127512 RepID=UPI0030132EE3
MNPAPPDLSDAVRSCRPALISLAVVSGLVNLLYLTGSFFMLVIYDRVIPSRSIPSLIGLVLLALLLYAFHGALEAMRGRMLTRIVAILDECLSARIFKVMMRAPRSGMAPGSSFGPIQDLDQIRSFLSSTAPAGLCDLPWMPLYFAICFLFHPLIGLTALGGALMLGTITLVTDRLTRGPLKAVSAQAARRSTVTEEACRNADVVVAMGMQDHFAARWEGENQSFVLAHQQVADISGGLGAVSKMSRIALQSGVLALCAYLVITGDGSSGIMLAASILLGRALAPLDTTIANWKVIVGAQQAWGRLTEMSARMPPAQAGAVLPVPSRALRVEGVAVAPPGTQQVSVRDVSFSLRAGQGLAITGPSGSGKSSLIRALIGVWPTLRGSVRLDGASITQWDPTDLGRHLGYLPQEVTLFAGSIAQNIARFSPDAAPAAIEAAARTAGVHDLILQLPNGYDTQVGEGGRGLSGGQRQRIGLARALFGEPFLVVLDEPNANLDQDGEEALRQAVLGVRARGGVVILVAHRMSALAGVDLILTMQDGRAQAFGPKEQVLARRG